jgi:flagellar basal-body rod modification protein FlgD
MAGTSSITDIQALLNPKAAAAAPSGKKQLGQNDFLKLMISQFKNQDPTKPVDSAMYVAQLAQFSQVAGLSELNTQFKTLADSLASNQALQASSLLGRDVLVNASASALEAGGALSGAVDLQQSSAKVLVNVVDEGGAVVRQIDLGAQGKGLANFSWNGRKTDGSHAAAGLYHFQAIAFDAASQATSAATLISAPVESVTMGAGQTGLTLTLKGLGDIAFSDVRRIG